MQPFEFLMIVVSIIVGLGITQLLAGVVRVLRAELKPYWIHELWVLSVFLMLLQYSWSLFDLEAQSDWVFLELLGLLTPPVLLYVVASLLFPTRGDKADLSSFYYAHRKPVFGLLAVLLVFYSVQGWIQAEPLRFTDLFRGLGLAIYAVLIATDRQAIHAVLSIVTLGSLIAFIGSQSYVLGSFEQ